MHATYTAPAYTYTREAPSEAELWQAYNLYASARGGLNFSPDLLSVEYSSALSTTARQSARAFKTRFPSWCVSLDGWQFLA